MDVKRLSIKNKAFFLPTKLINLLDFDSKKLEINKEGDDEIGIYYIRYGGGPLYLTIDNLSGYFEENDGNKYFNLVSFCDGCEDKYINFWEEIKNSINKVAISKFSDYSKDYGLIRFDSDDVLPLNEMIEIDSLTIVVRSVLEKDDGYYPQIFLDDYLYKV